MFDKRSQPRVTFGMIVLNGEPFLKYNLRSLYPFAHQIIIVEGACTAAASLSTPTGHSKDSTLETISRFKAEEDPENKVVLVTAEDEGKPDGFWTEKDEMSQAYARRAMGDWLWQVDSDEFYIEDDMRRVFQMLSKDPDITAVSFPYKQFWGGFDYIEAGQWFDYDHPAFHRLFRWKNSYQYASHRPPTVIDEAGQDLRTKKWISEKQMRERGIYLYHYSYVLPLQAEQKVGYYSNVTWSDEFQNNDDWFKERYLELKDPYHVGEGTNYLTWLVRHNGPHPMEIKRLKEDIEQGRLNVTLRSTDDIDELLSRPSYRLGRWTFGLYLWIRWQLMKPRQAISGGLRKILHRLGIVNPRGKLAFIKRRGLRYRGIFGYEGIPGWLSEDEAITLFDLSSGLSNDNPIVVEIGSWLGKSSVVLTKGLESKNRPTLYCIDPFNGDGDAFGVGIYEQAMSTMDQPLLTRFMANVTVHGVVDIVRPLVGYSFDFAPGFKETIDMLFIDGNHEFAAVEQDYKQWSPLLRDGGVIAFHDVVFAENAEPVGPAMVVKKHIFNNPEWADPTLIDSLLLARKRTSHG